MTTKELELELEREKRRLRLVVFVLKRLLEQFGGLMPAQLRADAKAALNAVTLDNPPPVKIEP